MQGKIQLAAPDDTRFRKKRSQVLHRIQPIHARKGNHSVGRRIFTSDLKKQPPACGSSPLWETDLVLSRTAKVALCKRLPAFHDLSARQCGTWHSVLFLPSLTVSAFSIRNGSRFSSLLARKPQFRHEIGFFCRAGTGKLCYNLNRNFPEGVSPA